MTFVVVMYQAAKGVEWAPTSVVGYASLALSIAALASIAIAYGKWLEKLNGLGKRVHDVETESTIGGERTGAQEKEIGRLINQHGDLIRLLGEAKRGAEVCREDTEKLGIDIGSRVSDLTREVNALNNDLSNRLTRVETILDGRAK